MVILVSRMDEGKERGKEREWDEDISRRRGVNSCFAPNGKSDCAFVFGCFSLSFVVHRFPSTVIVNCVVTIIVILRIYMLIFYRQDVEMEKLMFFSLPFTSLFLIIFSRENTNSRYALKFFQHIYFKFLHVLKIVILKVDVKCML